MCAKHLPSVLSRPSDWVFTLSFITHWTCDFRKSLKLPAFSSTKRDNKSCLSLPQDCWRVPTSLCTGGRSVKCPVQGIIIFKGLQSFSARVAPRHYMILTRLPNQQRISTSVAVVASGGSPPCSKSSSILNLGTDPRPGPLTPVTQSKGILHLR